ncbi:MAG: triose-phosphate isomerase [Nitrospirae bacterium CG_4_10_14_0_8_um_filter_41_23]|nr:triose-phosphate isomerase [Nitrospirota bacterium]OIP60854.1 MAG: triose-phosphate isomerase [Nitrospirae bacterium CG2_30_41_42]PIQ94689.1 MAG: triose-phosphate isomerase [Nitrospirae bacterium CG11_big_fil_rev_8_21_14_0_20_41_14]PIV44649.1 MAG: triose-phosphate isomerase [Nitrospirae bacterium CG02_land_8_20_14_3_00_41_53]PIW86478.1 MAG: triose-phosphate isomerase [Nitrospirae bacterium CG_4_8_14_3_um_filter_41_47]PIY86322.1 MAG: triose-phosphate isomerase [Nitrospirae bacterium CG_4_10_
MRKPFIAANWKMNKTISETQEFIYNFIPELKDTSDVDIVLAPPFTSLRISAEKLKDTNVTLAAQNVFYEEKGAYTGEVSPLMLIDVGCKYAIIGHSERRQYFNETDEIVNKKIKAAKKAGLGIIFCIGESLKEREAGKTFDVLQREIEKGLNGIDSDNIIIAYEPIWAIGTGKTATPEQAQEAHAYIRERLNILYGNKADDFCIIYGGSVTPENVDYLMACKDVDGALVGGASLKVDSFMRIVKFRKES